MDNQSNSNKVFVYPNINASYKVVEDLMIFYAGAEVSLKIPIKILQMKMHFLSPTLNIAPQIISDILQG
jgi:hypothetical protein